jgi:hypothetical protein
MQTTATIETLDAALAAVNIRYDNNVIWNREPEKKGKRLHFTLRVKSSRESGHRVSWSGRHIPAACWHVHGHFFAEVWRIEPDALILAGQLKMTGERDNWQDRNIGSICQPMMYSNSCECEG